MNWKTKKAKKQKSLHSDQRNLAISLKHFAEIDFGHHRVDVAYPQTLTGNILRAKRKKQNKQAMVRNKKERKQKKREQAQTPSFS
jgi:hypothetical protein